MTLLNMWLSRCNVGYFKLKQMQPFLSCLTTTIYSNRQCSFLGKFQVPQGFETAITIYNSSAKKKVPLILKSKKIATWYMCGPTVYDDSHIGHACCYVKFDIIRRIMENIFGINVLLVMGITDIDDKIIKKSHESNVSIQEVSRKYELDFFKDMTTMRVMHPSSISRVTENIPHIISFCEKLIEKDFAYVTEEGNVYFKVAKGVSADVVNEMPEDTEINSDPLKKDKRDFVLWKVAKEKEPYWESPWCKGRPGWHIECSVLASKIFGSHLDVHSGGYDLLFPHHSNEKSQSEAYHNCPQWGNYWLHSGLLQVGNNVKMSKSIKNTISIKEFLKDNCVNDFRILCLQSPYRKNMIYCSETLTGAKGLHQKFHNFISESELLINGEIATALIDEDKLLSKLRNTEEQVFSFLSDDFNTSQAILCLANLIDVVNENLQSSTVSSSENGTTAIFACANYIDKMLEILGVNIMSKKRLNKDFVYLVDAAVEFRTKLRFFIFDEIEAGEIIAAQTIENIYNSFTQRISLIYDVEELTSEALHIKEAVNVTFKQSLEFVSTLQNTNISKNKKKAKLLAFCDALRSSLEKYGITIKDRKGVSTWSVKL
ncbi:hypothetical protein CDAR_207841 [Caerostris darwini]|uniref:cysteine--tRNA ligase n=1 Tax=Caerostris darwini TaxID=1538125 RepID=A0AAV4U3J0_9ARAC|nr:hypothetical protein CDAR_207841 [Caerostris darwini]